MASTDTRAKRNGEGQATRAAVSRGRRKRITASEAERTLVAVIRVGDRLLKACGEFFRPLDMTVAQYNVLRILEGAGAPLSQCELANRLLVSRASITSVVDKLEGRGLVIRCPCEDRRVKMVHLTEKGLVFVEETFEALQSLCAVLMTPLSKTEQQELRQLLARLSDGEP
jgi:DNA-binding MarR family transcriptional regulator